MKILSAFLIGLGISIIGLGLLYDPWAQERFDRTVRETARLEHKLLKEVDVYLATKNYVGLILTVAGFLIMNRLAILYIFVIPCVLGYGFFNYNFILYKSERFGDYQTICGALFYVAIAGSIIRTAQKDRKKTKVVKQKED